MGQRYYKNLLRLNRVPDPIEERTNLVKEVLRDGKPFPETLQYKDIDIAFKEWVEKDLAVTYEEKELPTMALFSAQRFSEYMETWQNNDDQKNILMNFKVITRENNPQQGTLHDKNMNIPGDRTYLMKRSIMEDENGRRYFLDYRMKQPFCVDIIYTLSVVTNKYELLNIFNTKVNDKFKAIQCYIRPNGHFLPMKLENISDESEYNMDDRQYFSQSYEIRVMAYIITEDDFITEEVPILKLRSENLDSKNSAYVEIEEIDPCDDSTPYYYQPLMLTMKFKECERQVKFKINTDFVVDSVEVSNVRSGVTCTINEYQLHAGEYTEDKPSFKEGEELYVRNINKLIPENEAIITLYGHNPSVVFDERNDHPESELDRTQFCEDTSVETEEGEVKVTSEEINCMKD
jgi:hypothetical protein